jgi:uncharacterized LabA/DUF88 family protein
MAKVQVLTYTYVDNSNLFIEGQRLSAVNKKMALDLDDAIARQIFDTSWNVEYGKLHEFLCGDKSEVGAAKLWGSIPPEDSFWQMVKKKGWHVETFPRSFGKERKVDPAIAYHLGKDGAKLDPAKAQITLVAGDKDFVPVVQDLVKEKFKVCVAFWDHAAQELQDAASEFFSLNKWHDHLRFDG